MKPSTRKLARSRPRSVNAIRAYQRTWLAETRERAESGSPFVICTSDEFEEVLHAFGIPVRTVTLEGAKLTLDVPAVHGSFVGTVSADGKTIDGTWTQGSSLRLTFTRTAASGH